jgi:hypothetical protein
MQSTGDWTGYRWIQTYSKIGWSQRYLTKQQPLYVKTIESDQVFKINEDHDSTQAVVGYALQETINTKENLLYWFFNQILGDQSSDADTLGKATYEKISNFVANNSDIDVCNIHSIRAMSKEIGCDITNFEYQYPGSMKRLIDLLSIKRSKLIGSRDRTGMEFNKNGYANNFNHGKNISGMPVDFNNYVVNVGSRLIARELYNNTHTLIEPMAIAGDTSDEHYSTLHQGLTAYNLNQYNTTWGWGLSYPVNESVNLYYDFLEYVPDETYDHKLMNQLEGVIDWNNEMTTAEETTSLNDWNRPGGLTEALINKNIRKGIGLFK